MMNAFVRRLAALSVLWALCELLLPEGGQQRLARFTVSAMVMISLVSALGGLLGVRMDTAPTAPAVAQAAPDESHYRMAALRSLANQAQGLCQRVAARAGYRAVAAAYLGMDGALDHVELALEPMEGQTALCAPAELAARLADALGAEPSRIWLTDGTGAP